MQAFAMGCMGHPDVQTPNLDRLAKQGTLFSQAYSCGPVCTPFRGMLVTGRYGCQNGLIAGGAIPPDEPLIGHALNDAGYHSSYVGKWHLGGSGNQAVTKNLRAGFTDFLGYQNINSFISDIVFFDNDDTPHEYHGHRTNITTDLAIQQLDAGLKNGQGKPVALFVSYQNPHYPLQPSPEFMALYKGRMLSKRPNHHPDMAPLGPPPENLRLAADTWDMDAYIRLYCAMVTQLDFNIGRLLDHLTKTGQADNTVIIFTSDHGDMQGSHGFNNKSRFYEESARIPLIIYDPRASTKTDQGTTTGRVIDTPVGSIDYYPTILDFAGMPTDAAHLSRAEGRSMVHAVLTGRPPEPRPVLIEEIGRPCIAVRDGDYKLAMHRQTHEVTHFYDLNSDRFEMNNLVGLSEHATNQARVHGRLVALLKDLRRRTNPAATFPKWAEPPSADSTI
jgi:arylsulfatase A-like enzyme